MSKGFDELLNFPTVFVFRIIAQKQDTIEERCKEALQTVFDTLEATESIPSKTERFLRIHIAVSAISAEQLYKGYDALREVEGIRMVF